MMTWSTQRFRSAMISSRSRYVREYRKCHRTHRRMITSSKCRPRNSAGRLGVTIQRTRSAQTAFSTEPSEVPRLKIAGSGRETRWSQIPVTWPLVPPSHDEPRSGQGRPGQGQSHHAEHWLLGGQYPTPKLGHRHEDSSAPVKTPARVGGPWIRLHHTSI